MVPTSVERAGKPVICVRAPRLALAQLLELFHARPRKVTGIHPNAFVAPDIRCGSDVNIGPGAFVNSGVEIGDRVDIDPGAYVGEEVRIGDDSVISPHVSIYARTMIGKRVHVHSGAVIGSDGFGFTDGPDGGLYRIPQVGSVRIGDDVEIGANTTVDRATMADAQTLVGDGTKIDNLVQIGHNVEIAEHVCIVAQSGVAGSVRIGKRTVLGAAAGLNDHVVVGERARIAARAGVHDNVEAGSTVIGVPAIPGRTYLKAVALFPQLPEYQHRLKELEERCRRLEGELEQIRKKDQRLNSVPSSG